ncbi:MAG: DUF4062 domain-containing protein [Pyrinomonadaceae bacterium]
MKDVSVITVFVASPGDVTVERDEVVSVVNDLNISLCPQLGLRLEVLRWEENVVPDFDEYPQAAINKQIGDEYDIFVGILANRLGSKTKVAESGTLEEFGRAYARYQSDNDSVRLLIYFNEELVNQYSLDLDQVEKIRTFRHSLGEKGGLYRTYSGSDDFKTKFRQHLTSIVAGIHKRLSENPIDAKHSEAQNLAQTPKTAVEPTTKLEEIMKLAEEEMPSHDGINLIADGELGAHDYLDIYVVEFANLTDLIQGLSDLITNFGVQISKRTLAFEDVNKIQDARLMVSAKRRNLLLLARLFDSYCEISAESIRSIERARIEAFGSLEKAVTLILGESDEMKEEFSEFPAQLESYGESADEARIGIQGLRNTADQLVLQSSLIEPSRKRLVKALGELIAELEAHKTSSRDMKGTIEALLSDY